MNLISRLKDDLSGKVEPETGPIDKAFLAREALIQERTQLGEKRDELKSAKDRIGDSDRATAITREIEAIDRRIAEMNRAQPLLELEFQMLTLAAIQSETTQLSLRDIEITNERATLYANGLKAGRPSEMSPDTAEDEMAARQHAKSLLNGIAPGTLLLHTEVDRDRLLGRERRGIEIALKFLNKNEAQTRTAAALAWAKVNDGRYRKVAHDIVLAKVRLQALERAKHDLIAECPDAVVVQLPMSSKIDGLEATAFGRMEITVDQIVEAAIAEDIVTKAEVRKAAENG